MKGFFISLLAAGTALLLASLFWPGPSRLIVRVRKQFGQLPPRSTRSIRNRCTNATAK